jgi:hypothetical protein
MVRGALAQLVEHLLCKQGVNGSNPLSSTIFSALFTRLETAEFSRDEDNSFHTFGCGFGGFAAVL